MLVMSTLNVSEFIIDCIMKDIVGVLFFFFQAEDGIRDLVRSRGLGDVYKRQGQAGTDTKHGSAGFLLAGNDLNLEPGFPLDQA